MPTTPRTEEEFDRRIAAGVCVSSRYQKRPGKRRVTPGETPVVFYCDKPVSDAQRAAKCGLCEDCDREQEEEEGRCDGIAAARFDHQRGE